MVWCSSRCTPGLSSKTISPHRNECNLWIQGCADIPGTLKQDPNFKCRSCKGEIQIPDNQELRVVHKGDTIEVVKSFCYLGDCIGEKGGCYDATTVRIRSAWKTFRELVPIWRHAIKPREHGKRDVQQRTLNRAVSK